MLMTPIRCWRGLPDCEPLHSIETIPNGFDETEAMPPKFICCGRMEADARIILEDAYRLCVKDFVIDSQRDLDIRDLTHLVAVVGQALAISATRVVSEGID